MISYVHGVGKLHKINFLKRMKRLKTYLGFGKGATVSLSADGLLALSLRALSPADNSSPAT